MIDLTTTVPVAATTFVRARVPFALGSDGDSSLGNVLLEGEYVARYAPKLWFTFGGGFGFPTMARSPDDVSAARAFWDMHEVAQRTFPANLNVAGEWHKNLVELRAEVQFTALMPLHSRREVGIALQQAVEIQIGHQAGGGVRFQAVQLLAVDRDEARQAAIEPFFAFEQRLMFLRVGLLMPLQEPLGPPFQNTWAVRFETGFRLD